MLCNKLSFFRKIIGFKNGINNSQHYPIIQRCRYSQDLENKYNETQREKILKVINSAGADELSCYEVSKARSRKLLQYKNVNGPIQKLSDVDMIEDFSDKSSKKFFDSILEGPQEKQSDPSGIKGQYIQPVLSEAVRMACQSSLAVYITVNSVYWALIDRNTYQLTEWKCHSICIPGKKLQIVDILDIAWEVTQLLPKADVYVMKGEATTLRSPGSDPNNPKIIAVNLQKSQLVSMVASLLNARDFYRDENKSFNQKVYFIRSTLPYRLYGTLVGQEKVSTDQTIEEIFKEASYKSKNNTHVYIEDWLKNIFRNQKSALQQDMMGNCLLLALTFMDLCIYKSHDKIQHLAKR